MKRIMLIVAGVATIVVGSHALAATPPAVYSGVDTCTAGSGAVCTTEGDIPCCADGDACYSEPELCLAMFCESYPNSQRCAAGDTTGVH